MRRSAELAVLAGLPPLALAVLLLALAPRPEAAGPAPGYPDIPVLAHTGGLGEPTCQACHFGADLNEPGGRLAVEGWPDAAEPGASYPLTVRLEHPNMGRAGFQLAVRTIDGLQAGTLAPEDRRSAVASSSAGVAYLSHTLPGTDLTEPGAAEWALTWTAPEERTEVRLHLSANAADGDDSAFGDLIYADSLRAQVGAAR